MEKIKAGAVAVPSSSLPDDSAEERARHQDGEEQHPDGHRKQDLVVGGIFAFGFDLVHLAAPRSARENSILVEHLSPESATSQDAAADSWSSP